MFTKTNTKTLSGHNSPVLAAGKSKQVLPTCFATGSLSLVIVPLLFSPAWAEESVAPARQNVIEEIIVTAQKREENINDVGMSINAASGEKLRDLGVTDTMSLYKIISGFNTNVGFSGQSIYTMRGVGFQDTALASSPTVTVYMDQMPVNFSAMTPGLILDLQRVEAMKGPQGTLFGQNATGGAINYIANKPSSEFEWGMDASYGRFNEANVSGFVSGPISDTLSYRVALNSLTSDGWQKSFTNAQGLGPDPVQVANGVFLDIDDENGDKDLFSGRISLQWDPTDRLSALLTVSGFTDQGDTQRAQLFGKAPKNPNNPEVAFIRDYPLAPHDNRAADGGPCVTTNGGTPAGVTENIDANGNPENLNNHYVSNSCGDAEKDNDYLSTALRIDFDLTDDVTLTSLSSYGEYNRNQQVDNDGTIYQNYEASYTGNLDILFQEVRLAGTFDGQGTWVAGVNYEETSTYDSYLQSYGFSSVEPITVFTTRTLGPNRPNSKQKTDTYALFGNITYPLGESIIAQAGIRYADQKRDYRGCGNDGGDGTWASISTEIQMYLQLLSANPPAELTGVGSPGLCATAGWGPTFYPDLDGFTNELNEDNVSWRVGLNWEATSDALYYFNISQGYKSGSFPTVSVSTVLQLEPVTQEDLLAYEIGAKILLLDSTLQLNTAVFFYDYTDKQILGAIPDAVFGSLAALVNVPESHVYGAEFTAEWYPIEGLRIAPSMSYAESEIDGTFRNFDSFYTGINSGTKDFSGQPFPNAPKWLGNLDVQYEWSIGNGNFAFIGGNVNYQSKTRGFFYDECKEVGVPCTKTIYPGLVGDSDLIIKGRALIDLRVGIELDSWRISAWGRNVSDKHYWNHAQHVNDTMVRFTGMPRTYGVTVSYRPGN